MKREFSSLSVQEALHVAIFIEERNADIYQQFAALFTGFKDPDSLTIAQVFSDMAEEERHHGSELQNRYLERFGTKACTITEDEISDLIEVPRLESGNIFAVEGSPDDPGPREKALQVALAAEKTALSYYARLTAITSDEELRAFYFELSTFEGGHVTFLERKLAETRATSGGEES
jgi:rubrerythrin